MAIDIWKGPGGAATAPTSGDFLTAGYWSGGVPNANADAVLNAGSYTVTLTNAAEVRSINVGTGATLAIAGGSSSLTIFAPSFSSGAVAITGGYIVFGAEFANVGTLRGDGGDGFIAELFGEGQISNAGLITGTGLFIHNTVVNEAGGVVRGDRGTVYLIGATTNDGVIEAVNGGTVSTTGFNATGTVTNYANGALSGGTWVAHANSTILLANATISRLADGAVVTLDGVGSTFRVDDGSSPFTLEQTLNLVDVGATLAVLGGRDWRTSETLAVRGALHLGGGVFAPGDLRVEKGATMTGFGTVASQAIVDGGLKIDRGQTLEFTTFTDFNGRIGGTGTLALTGGEDTFTTSKVTIKHLLFDGADVQFDRNLKYAGELTVTTGTVELKDSALTLAGKATIGDATIQGGPGGVLSVTGELRSHGATTELEVRTIRVDGAVAVDHGALRVNGTVAGSGAILVGVHGTLEFEAQSKLSAGPLVTLAGSNATLVFDNLESGRARVAQFDGHDRIDFAAVSSTGAKATWRADADGQGGTLRVSNGGQTATVHLEENHVKADFALKTDAGGGTVVTLAKTAAFGVADAGAFGADAPAGGHPFAPAHEWHGTLALV